MNALLVSAVGVFVAALVAATVLFRNRREHEGAGESVAPAVPRSRVVPSAEPRSLLLLFPRGYEGLPNAKLIGWRLDAGRTLAQSLAGSFWIGAARSAPLVVLVQPDGFCVPHSAERCARPGHPQWFSADITTDEADKLLADISEFRERRESLEQGIAPRAAVIGRT